MPTHLKLLISCIALAVSAAVFFYDTAAGAGFSRWVPVFLGPFAVFSIWVFPEAKAGEIRKEAARRREDA